MVWPAEHWERVKRLAYKLHADGCSGVPDLWFRLACYDHDIAYRTHKTAEGEPITKWEADRNLRHEMALYSPLGRMSILAWVYWAGVVLLGNDAWNANFKPTGGSSPPVSNPDEGQQA